MKVRLRKAIAMKKSWSHVTDNKLRGAYGETDYEKQRIRVNKKKHKKDKELLLDTIVHEEIHKKHPKMKEKNVKKLAASKTKKMSTKTKKRHYSLYA